MKLTIELSASEIKEIEDALVKIIICVQAGLDEHDVKSKIFARILDAAKWAREGRG